MKALVVRPGAPGNVALAEVDEPVPESDEAVVAVRAVSLNRGEVRALATAPPGTRPGWDVAGEVVTAAADGTGPRPGERVVGLVRAGGWAERTAMKTWAMGSMPEGLSFAEASTLPVAGLTALRGLQEAGITTGHRVLVTGAAGGVGRFAVQLAAHQAAEVWAVVGQPERGKGLDELGAGTIVVGMPAPDAGPFEIILESVGGESLARAIQLLAQGGTIVAYGNSSQQPTTFDLSTLYRKGAARIYAFMIFHEVERTRSAPVELGQLADLVATGRLQTSVVEERSWLDPAPAFQALLDRAVTGKIVLRIE